jgi:hypothetical protein
MQKNLLTSYPFIGILITLTLAVIPVIQKARVDSSSLVDTTLAIVLAVASAGATTAGLHNSNNITYYTPPGLPGRDPENPNPPEEGNF